MTESTTYPAYMALYASGELARRAEQARERLAACTLCAEACRANRLGDEIGECGQGRYAVISSAYPHFGEERVLSGHRGSGTIFFAGCNLHCVFCQNFDISQQVHGIMLSSEELASVFLDLQIKGCHNLNLVSPSHVIAQILEALLVAVEDGFRLPIVYNTGGYDSLQSLRLLDGVVDIYMPDMKYGDSATAASYSGVPHYWEVSTQAVKEMHRQVGPLVISNGLARRGLLIRHLVLPNDIAGTRKVLQFIAEEVSHDTWINIMDQYRPSFQASSLKELSRPISRQEYINALSAARLAGLHRGVPLENTD